MYAQFTFVLVSSTYTFTSNVDYNNNGTGAEFFSKFSTITVTVINNTKTELSPTLMGACNGALY